MPVLTMEKPQFTKDQVVPATFASKSFATVRKRAKIEPQFIFDHNAVDAVLIDYDSYAAMYGAWRFVQELEIERLAEQRLQEEHAPLSLEDVLSADELAEYEAIDPNTIPDEELFA